MGFSKEYLNDDSTLQKESISRSHWGGYRLKSLIVKLWRGHARRTHDIIRSIRPATDDEG